MESRTCSYLESKLNYNTHSPDRIVEKEETEKSFLVRGC
jgi:hypothetical protein